MRTRQRLRATNNVSEENFWPSFTDMISTIAIILFFLILIIFIKNIIIANDLNAKQMELIDNQQALDKVKDEIAVKNAEISEKETNLMLLEQDTKELLLEVEQGEIALKLSQEQIINQQIIIANSNQELGDMRTKIQQIAVIRLDILDRVRRAIESEIENTDIAAEDNSVLIGDNGNIVLNNKLLFSSNSSRINEDGKVVLAELAQVFKTVLEDDELNQYIDAIQIEGHTDDVNTEEHNRNLSAERAINVVNYILASDDELEDDYGAYFVASAFSEYRPLSTLEAYAENVAEARAKNRRIEISIILKDNSIQDIIDDYLDGNNSQLLP